MNRTTRRWTIAALAVGACGVVAVTWTARRPDAAPASSLGRALDPLPRLRDEAATLVRVNGTQAPTTEPPPTLSPSAAQAVSADELLVAKQARVQALRDALVRKDAWRDTNLGERVRRLREPLVAPATAPP
jgi:hypothetical protein